MMTAMTQESVPTAQRQRLGIPRLEEPLAESGTRTVLILLDSYRECDNIYCHTIQMCLFINCDEYERWLSVA